MLSTLFAARYFRTRRTTHAINLISRISVAAIAVVTAALIVVMSVFNGFEDLVKSLYSDFYSDIRITPAKAKHFQPTAELLEKLSRLPGISGTLTVVEERAVLLNGEEKAMVWLKGVPPGYDSQLGINRHVMRGAFRTGDATQPGLVLGAGVENALLVNAAQSIYPVTVYLPNRQAGMDADISTALNSANVAPTGTFAIQQEFDNQYAFTDIGFMRYMLDLEPNACSAIELNVANQGETERIATQVQQLFGQSAEVKTRFRQNQALYAAMQMEKLIIFGVAFLILLIAAFNIVSSLTMTVIEKQPDIAVLGAMGASSRQIKLIYLKLANLMAGVGAMAGFAIGWLICLGQQKFHWVKLGGESFIIDHYPVAVRLSDFLIVGIIVILIALLAGYFPARRAAAVSYSLKA
jgi:lipoprotein-releasing system permease protein